MIAAPAKAWRSSRLRRLWSALASLLTICLLAGAVSAQNVPLGPRFVLPYQTVIDPTGVPIPGAQLFFYASGTTSPLRTYSDPLLTTPNTNPVVANAAGVFPAIFLSGNYKIVLEDYLGDQIWTADPVLGELSGGSGSAVLSISNSDGTLTISPTVGSAVASINLAHANTWPGQQTFVAPNLGTPSYANLINAIGLPLSGIGSGTTPNLPVIGNGSGGLTQGTRSGNTTAFATTNGTLSNGHCVSIDSVGNLVDAGGSCTTGGGGGTVGSGTAGQIAYYSTTGSLVIGAPITPTGIFATKAAFVSALSGMSSAPWTWVHVEAVATPGSGYGTCGLDYIPQSTSTGVYGEISGAGVYWEPKYTDSPVKTCEFGAIGNASFSNNGAAFTASANGTTTLSVSSTSGLAPNEIVAAVNWHSTGSTAIPVGTTIVSVGSGSIVVSNTISTATGLNLVAYMPLSQASGTDSTAAIQAALNHAMQNGLADIQIANGSYITSSAIQLGWGETFRHIELIGEKRGAFSPGGQGVVVYCTATNQPCVNAQAGRRIGLSGMLFIGPNFTYNEYGQELNYALSADKLDWLAPALNATGSTPGGLQTNSPMAGFCVDCYAGASPSAPYPNLTFPAFTGLSAQYSKSVTSDVLLDDVSFNGFAVGVVSGANTQAQGDFIKLTKADLSNNIFGLSVNNSQSRNVQASQITGAGLFTMFDNVSFGLGQGVFGGEISGISAGEIYQLFNFNNSYLQPTIMRTVYCEVCTRLGVYTESSSYGTSLVFDGGVYGLSDEFTGIEPPALIVGGGVQGKITLRGGFTLVSFYRMQNLLWNAGSAALLSVDDAQFSLQTIAASVVASTQGEANAYTFTGGVFVGSSKYSTSGVDYTTWGSVNAGVCSGPSTCPSSEIMRSTAQGNVSRVPFLQSTNSLLDATNRLWQIHTPQPGYMQVNSSYMGVLPSATNDIWTFTELGSVYTGYGYSFHLQPGLVLVHAATGTLFVVTAVGSVDGSGNYPITMRQQNNMKVNPSTGVFVSNLFAGFATNDIILTASGAGVMLPTTIAYGTFSTSSNTVSSANRGDGYGGFLTSSYSSSDPICQIAGWTQPGMSPMAGNQCMAINAVTNGSPGSLTLSALFGSTFPSNAGTFPVFPFPIQ